MTPITSEMRFEAVRFQILETLRQIKMFELNLGNLYFIQQGAELD